MKTHWAALILRLDLQSGDNCSAGEEALQNANPAAIRFVQTGDRRALAEGERAGI